MKYGKMTDHLLSLTIVTGRGEIVRLGPRKVPFSSTGYKLHYLMIGSEGTLGIITEATLRVYPKLKSRVVRGYVFPSIKSAIDALKRLIQAGVCPEAANINCKRRLAFYTHAYKVKYGREPDIPKWAEAVLFIVFAGDEEVVRFYDEYSERIMKEFGGAKIKEEEIVQSWWISKHTLEFPPERQKWPDSQRKKKFGAADLGIPIGRVEEAYKRFLEIAEKHKLEVLGMNIYNQKPNTVSASISFAVFVDDRNPYEVRRFYEYVKEMSKMAVDLEGTMSTYIGDGFRLGGFNKYEHGKAFDLMREIKRVFDPNGILNPGKKFESLWIKFEDGGGDGLS
ncbi:MAG: FAD-binding oxidoreductase [Candidatus Baldrarchaeia archaeon]